MTRHVVMLFPNAIPESDDGERSNAPAFLQGKVRQLRAANRVR